MIAPTLTGVAGKRTSLRRFARFVSGTGFPVEAQGKSDLELPFFKVKDLKSAGHDGVLAPAGDTISRETAKALGATVIPRGSLVLAKVGAALLLGRVGVLPVDGCIDNNMAAVVFTDDIDPDFARYVMSTFSFGRYVLPGPVPSLDMEAFREFKVPALPIDEQRAIADYLVHETGQVDRLVAKQEEFIGLLRERRDATWAHGFSEAASRIRLTPLRRVVTSIVDGPFGSSLTSAHYADSGTRVIRLGNIGLNTFRPQDEAYIPDSYAKQLGGYEARPGDVVIAGLGDEKWPLGRAAVVPDIGPAIVKADCFRVRPASGVTSDYLAWALSAPQTRTQVALLARGSTRQRINTAIARTIEIPVPSASIQKSILMLSDQELCRIDALIAKAEQHISLAKKRRSALITAAVTGQIDVRTARKAA